ncbi:MAG: hypothetical protein QM675_00185 [Protaetiibacter sp.]
MSDGLQIFDVPADADAVESAAESAGTADAPVAHAASGDRSRPRWPGSLAGGIAILMVVTWAIALACSLAGLLELGVGLSISAILLSGIAVLAGIVAVAGNWGRGWGIAAIAVGVLLNPVVLLYGLGWIGAL